MRNMRMLALSTLLVLGTAPAFAATLLVLNKDDATLSFIDPDNGRTTASVPTGMGPHEVETSPDGRLAVVSNYGTVQAPGNSLSLIDLAARRERQRTDLGSLQRPHGLAIAGTHAYFTAEGAKSLGSVDLASGGVDWKFLTDVAGTHMVLASRDGRLLITANIGADSVSFIDRAADGSAKQTLVATGKGPEGLDLSPDGKQLWVANSGDGSVAIVDVATRQVAGRVDVRTRRSNRLKFTPDGRTVLVSDLVAGELVVLDARDRSERARIKVGGGAAGILVAPGGSRAYVALSSEGAVAVVDLKALRVVDRIVTGRGPDGMAWVP